MDPADTFRVAVLVATAHRSDLLASRWLPSALAGPHSVGSNGGVTQSNEPPKNPGWLRSSRLGE